MRNTATYIKKKKKKNPKRSKKPKSLSLSQGCRGQREQGELPLTPRGQLGCGLTSRPSRPRAAALTLSCASSRSRAITSGRRQPPRTFLFLLLPATTSSYNPGGAAAATPPEGRPPSLVRAGRCLPSAKMAPQRFILRLARKDLSCFSYKLLKNTKRARNGADAPLSPPFGALQRRERAGGWQCGETTSPMRQRAAHAHCCGGGGGRGVPAAVAGSAAEVTRGRGS